MRHKWIPLSFLQLYWFCSADSCTVFYGVSEPSRYDSGINSGTSLHGGVEVGVGAGCIHSGSFREGYPSESTSVSRAGQQAAPPHKTVSWGGAMATGESPPSLLFAEHKNCGCPLSLCKVCTEAKALCPLPTPWPCTYARAKDGLSHAFL